MPRPLAGDPLTLSAGPLNALSEAEQAIAALNARGRPARAALERLLLRTEAIASSWIEGVYADPRALAAAEGRPDRGAAAGGELGEVLANIDAMRLALEQAEHDDQPTLDQVLGIHAALIQRSPIPSIAGVVRKSQNWIGRRGSNPCDAAFVPPPPEFVPDLLADLSAFAGVEDVPALLQAAVAHAQFETIHPFADGNGRTGRALVHLLLRRRGLAPAYVPPISVVFARDRHGYVGGLTAFRQGDLAGWVEHFAAAAAEAAWLASTYLAAVERLQETWRGFVAARGAPRSHSAVWAIIDALPALPVVTAPAATAATGRSKPSVNQAVAVLAEAGVLIPLTESRRNRAWEARGLLDLLGELEAGRPSPASRTDVRI